MVDSKYYNVEDFNSLKFDLPSTFSLCHVNIASLDRHIDDLRLALSRFNHNFDVIGISEHKIKKDSEPASNIDIVGYSFESTSTSHGGTGFYIKK